MKTSATLAEIAPALVGALSKLGGVGKTKANPGFKGSKYADLESVIDASKAILAEHNLAIMQLPGALVDGVLTLETIILHASGEFISGDFGIALGKMDPQGVGSAITYARRYAQMAALNMPAVDDDGEAAMGRNHTQTQSQTKTMGAVAPTPPTLAQRADRLEVTLKAVKTEDELRKAYALASGLCADLDAKDPERLVAINTLYEARFNDFAKAAA